MSNWSFSVSINRLLAALAVLAVLVTASPASADGQNIVILNFSGTRGSKFRSEVVKIVQRDYKVIPDKRYQKAAKKLKAKRMTPRHVAKVAAELEAVGVLSGTIKKSGTGYEIELVMRSGSTGREQGTVTHEVADITLSRDERNELRDKLQELISDLPGLDAGDDGEETIEEDPPVARGKGKSKIKEEDEPVARGKDSAKGKDKSKDKDKGKKAKNRGKGDDEQEEETIEEEEADSLREAPDTGDAEEDDAPRAAAPAKVAARANAESTAEIDSDDAPRTRPGNDEAADADARWRTINLDVGPSVHIRNLTFGTTQESPDDVQQYKGNPVPGVAANAELYLPVGAPQSFLRWIGVSAVFEQVLLLEVKPPGSMMTLPATQRHWGAGLVVRYNLGSSPDGLTVKLSARYNRLSFAIDKGTAGATINIPNVDYAYIDPGVTLRKPLGPLAIILSGRFLAVLDAGDIQEPAQYGSATITAFELSGGLEYRINNLLGVRAGANFANFSYDFDKQGMLAVDSATDRYLGGHVTLGVSF